MLGIGDVNLIDSGDFPADLSADDQLDEPRPGVRSGLHHPIFPAYIDAEFVNAPDGLPVASHDRAPDQQVDRHSSRRCMCTHRHRVPGSRGSHDRSVDSTVPAGVSEKARSTRMCGSVAMMASTGT